MKLYLSRVMKKQAFVACRYLTQPHPYKTLFSDFCRINVTVYVAGFLARPYDLFFG